MEDVIVIIVVIFSVVSIVLGAYALIVYRED